LSLDLKLSPPFLWTHCDKLFSGPRSVNKTLDESREKELAELEASCMDTLALAGTEFFDLKSTSRRNNLAFYAALLFCRATQRRNHVHQKWAKFHSDLSEVLNDE
jgi:hypothetical protein